MNALFAMGIPNTTDDSGYFLWLAHAWTVFLPPALAICVALAFWVKRMVRRSGHGIDPSGPVEAQTQPMSREPSLGSESEPPPSWPLEFEAA
jgi:hypothetical protein